ncbi:GIY-YIG nuclease family protein [Novosphingobium flavum]|uniref:GIY-YIG nuclease family protein n=1 Tax=Novosphingobium flavum TaxID=1778672 RepID=A0A7X1FUR6_9SPHN|nr:GIY-YIG nuclease family protein [Novosphingobium flavum]MBC2667338.1 GIY-YIG nuclease family protein [Novosphingobium flavum]
MLNFRTMLELEDLDPAEVLIVRHIPREASLARVLPWLVVERPDLFLAWQQIQWASLEKAMTRARYIASFVSQDSKAGTFAGIYRIGSAQTLDYEGYCAFPGNRELEELGMSLREPDMAPCLAFDLERLRHYEDYIGRLTISWPPPFQGWWRRAKSGAFPVMAIDPESRFVRGMPDWHDLVLNWHELRSLPASWAAKLAQWRGVYFIHDVASGSGYVGSACGEDNILGRWLNYARTGHGGNAALRACDPANLSFSILQRTSPDLEVSDVVALETSWKNRLHTRRFGLNRN